MSSSSGRAGARAASPRSRGARELRIAGRLIRPELNRIELEGRTVQVEPKIMQVLVCLVDHAGEVVTKEELLHRVWSGLYVTQDVLVRAVSELRKLLEGEEGERVIETIRTRGYRLVAPVVYELPRTAGPVPAAVESSGLRRRRAPIVALAALAAIGLAGLVALLARTEPPTPPPPATRSPRFAPVTTLAGNEFHPALSPDGTRVVFSWAGERPGNEEAADLYLRSLDAPAPIALTTGGRSDWAPAWSPDGDRVAFLRFEHGCEIAVVPALGGPADRLGPCTDGHSPRFAWSGDARSLVATRARPGSTSARLVRVPLGGGEPEPVTGGEGAFRDTDPAVSPDGGTIAFVRRVGGLVGDVHRVPAAGGEATRLTFDDAEVIGVTWIDGGRRIAFSSNRAGLFSLWAVPAAGGEPELVAGGGRKIKHPSASRAGDAVAYEAWDCEMNLCALPVDGSAHRIVAPASDHWTFDPRYAPDGASLAFVSTRSGTYEIWTSRADGGEPRRLTSFGGPWAGHPRWSPDGRRLAFVARPDGRGEVWLAELAGGALQRLTTADREEAAPSWSADGERLYFSARQSGAWQLVERRLATGGERILAEVDGYAALEDPEGRWLYYTRSDRAGLWRRAWDGRGGLGAEETVTEALRPEEWASWGVGAPGVWWLEHRPEGPTVVLRRPGAETPVALTQVPDLAWSGLDLSPDGERLVYSRFGRNDSNIQLVSWR